MTLARTKEDLAAAVLAIDHHFGSIVVSREIFDAWLMCKGEIRARTSKSAEMAAVPGIAQAVMYAAAARDNAESTLEELDRVMGRMEHRRERKESTRLIIPPEIQRIPRQEPDE